MPRFRPGSIEEKAHLYDSLVQIVKDEEQKGMQRKTKPIIIYGGDHPAVIVEKVSPIIDTPPPKPIVTPKKIRRSWIDKTPFEVAKLQAEDRGKAWTIPEEEYYKLVSQPCVYCQTSLSASKGIRLDRLDNSKGYSLENVLPCCGSCNMIRGNRLTHQEMKVAMKAVLDFRA